jgi:hypothetical protein
VSHYERGGNGFQRVTINSLMLTVGTAGDDRNRVVVIRTSHMNKAKDRVNALVKPRA